MSWNRTKGFWFLFAVLIAFVSCETAPQTMVVAGSGWNKVVKAEKSGTILWRHDLEKGQECNEVTELKNGNVLYAHGTGAKVVSPSHEVRWKYNAPKGTELQSASLTKEGNYLLGQCGNPSKVMEFSVEGDKLFEISIETGIDRPHSQFRRVRKTEDATYLIPLLAKRKVCEFDASGKLIKEVEVKGVPFSVVILENKNWLVSCGDAHQLVEINPSTGEFVWEVNKTDIDGVSLQFVAEAVRLQNGNTVICNWGGHAHGENPAAQIVEIDKDLNVVWKLEDRKQFGLISTIDPQWCSNYLR